MNAPISQALHDWRGAIPATIAAKTLGISKRTYEGWEQGRAVAPTTVALLAKVMALINADGSLKTTHHPTSA